MRLALFPFSMGASAVQCIKVPEQAAPAVAAFRFSYPLYLTSFVLGALMPYLLHVWPPSLISGSATDRHKIEAD